MRFSVSAKGFTLIEILVALFIVVIVAVVLARLVNNAIKTRHAIAIYQSRINQLNMAMLSLHRDLTQIAKTPIVMQQKTVPSLVGEAMQWHMIRGGNMNPMGEAARSTLLRVQYSVVSGKLIRQSIDLFSDEPHVTRQVLLPHVESMKIQYIAADHRSYPIWPRAQTQATVLPIGMEVRLCLSDWGCVTQTIILGAEP